MESRSTPKFEFYNNGTSYYGGMYSGKSLTEDTTGYSKTLNHYIDSVRSSLGQRRAI